MFDLTQLGSASHKPLILDAIGYYNAILKLSSPHFNLHERGSAPPVADTAIPY